MRTKMFAVLTALALLAGLAGTANAAKKKPAHPTTPVIKVHKVSVQNGGEPSITATHDGWLYISYPGSAMSFYSSHNMGRSWTHGGNADSSSGDTTVNVDTSGAVYESNLNPNNFQGDVYKSLDHGTTWPQVGRTQAGDSSTTSPFLMDRQWTDAYIPPGGTTDTARVYIAYHDFGPNQIWVNTSKDGGKTFSLPTDVISSPEAHAASFCNTVPGGLRIVKSGPLAGRVYVMWLAADTASNLATGCNLTQMDTFHTIWLSWSDDEGTTWASKQVYDGAFMHDASTLFADLSIDNQGNPYTSFGMNLNGEFDAYVMASFDGGQTWNAAQNGQPIKINKDTGTHYFVAVAAGDPGKVDVTYIATSVVVPVLPYGKPAPGGSSAAKWDLYMAQSLNLKAATPKWTIKKITTKPMHFGDVCTLGLFCLAFEPLPVTEGPPFSADRNLLDFIDIVVDDFGRAHIAYTDDADRHCICSADQTAGPDLVASK